MKSQAPWIATLLLVFTPLIARAAASVGPQGIAVHGMILNAQGLPEVSSSVVFTLDIRSPGNENCLLYRETQTLDMSDSAGSFSFILGYGGRSGAGFENTSTLMQVFNNSSGTLTGLTCANGTTYTPVSGQQRSLALAFNDGAGLHSLYLPLNIEAVPYALNADRLQGLLPSQLLNLGTTPSLTQANAENLFSTTNYPKLVTLLANDPTSFLTVGGNGTVSMPVDTSDPVAPRAGQIWFSAGQNMIKYYDGSAIQTLGTAAPPGVVSGNAITSGTIGGSTAIATTGAIQTSGAISSARQILFDHSGAGPGYVGMQAPANLGANSYSLTWPSSAGGTGQVMVTDGTGLMTWIDRTRGVLTSVTANAPLQVSGGSQTPVLTVSPATTSASGVVTLATNGGTDPLSVVQADDARLTDARTPSGTATGDLSAAYPAPLVAKLRGVTVSATAPTSDGQLLRFNGSIWKPQFLSMFDIRSSFTGAQAFDGVGCSSAQTLTWTAITDSVTCTTIGIAGSQVTYANQSAHAIFSGPTSGTAAPSFRALVASDLPSGAYDTTYFRTGGNAFGAAAVLGTSDSNSLSFVTGGTSRAVISANGAVGVGISTPTATLHLKAGTAAAGGAPLKLSAGTNLTAAETGAIEFDGSNLFYTDSGAVRRQLANTSAATSYSSTLTAGASGTSLSVINNETLGGTLTQTYTGTSSASTVTANSVASVPAASIAANALTSGSVLSLSSNSTAATAGNTGLNVAISGANAAASITRYGIQSSVTATGTTSTNVAGYFSASGASLNNALIVGSGNVGLGTATPSARLDVTGHVANSGSAATVASCGTAPALSGNDTRGTVTLGTGTVTSCVVTFNSSFASAPVCVATWSGAASAIGIGVSATTNALTISLSASAPGLKVNYNCLQ